MTTLPDSVSAAIRYAIALAATAFGVLTTDQVAQVSSAAVTIITVIYGVWRTHTLAAQAKA
jgi:hypothetical protein